MQSTASPILCSQSSCTLFDQGTSAIHDPVQVPLDHNDKHSASINLFVRDVSALSKVGHKLPTLLFLQGQVNVHVIILRHAHKLKPGQMAAPDPDMAFLIRRSRI